MLRRHPRKVPERTLALILAAAVRMSKPGSSKPEVGVRVCVGPLIAGVFTAGWLAGCTAPGAVSGDPGPGITGSVSGGEPAPAAQDSGSRSPRVDLAPARVAVRNTPPVIFVSHAPVVLIPVEGAPVWRPVPESRFERVLGTRAAILREKRGEPLYLHVYDGWLTSHAVNGPWSRAPSTPARIDEVAAALARTGQVDLLDGGDARPRPSLASGAPAIYVSQAPAELIVFEGKPNLQPIEATSLLWASNTTTAVIVDASDDAWYVLLAGRWFIAPSLQGPWSYVASTRLPVEFSRIPAGSSAGRVLASVAGTTQAQAALIANSIPQTARVSLENGPAFTAHHDGPPQLAVIPGTPLQYLINSPTPTLRVDASAWYALRAGVWFVAPSAYGPFTVATWVPAVIYTIPPASPLHYVTYVEIHGSTAHTVDVGYTPGYLGTVVSPDGVVVYGTGYVYPPWIGTAYFASPPTWSVMAQPAYGPEIGWSFGFALGLTTAAMLDAWGSPASYTEKDHGHACCASTGANVYGYWGNGVTSAPRLRAASESVDGAGGGSMGGNDGGWSQRFPGGGFGDRFGEAGRFGAGPAAQAHPW